MVEPEEVESSLLDDVMYVKCKHESTNGCRPIVVYWRVASFRKRRVRSCGDRQLEKDVDTAITWFEKNLERNPSQRAQAHRMTPVLFPVGCDW